MKKLTCLLLLLAFFPFKTYSQQKFSLQIIGNLSNVKLQKNYVYVGFDVNEDYLVWYEMYQKLLFVYNLKKDKLKKIKLKEGRGPHEVLQIVGLTITDNNIINLADYNNIKFIRLKLSGKFLKDQIAPAGIRPMDIVNNNGYQLIADLMNQKALFFLRQGENFIPIKYNNSDQTKVLRGPFEKEGYSTIQKHYLIHLTRYYPYIYLYDLEKKALVKKIKFDESAVSETENRSGKNGAVMMYPPSKVDILSEDVARIPGVPGRIFLLAKGKSENRDYDLHNLYVYDYIKEKFIRTIDLGVKAEAIAVNDNYLFIYSKGDYKIYKYKIIHSE